MALRIKRQSSFDSQATMRRKPFVPNLPFLDLEDDFSRRPSTKRHGCVETGSLSSRSLSGFSSSSTASSIESSYLSADPIFIGSGCIGRLWQTCNIFTTIISYLEEDKRTLRNVSLCCRSMRQLVIPLLFRRITVPCYPVHGRMWGNGMVELIGGRSQHLIPHITHVVLRYFHPVERCDDPVDENALRVLLNLTAITQISINGDNARPSWLSVNRAIQKAIRTTLCMPTKRISVVEVNNIKDFPVYLLGACRYLRELTLDGAELACSPRQDTVPDNSQRRRIPQALRIYDQLQHKVMLQTAYQDLDTRPIVHLEFLKFAGTTANLVDFGHLLLSDEFPLNITQLKSLELHQKGGGFSFLERQEMLRKLLNQCHGTLHDLRLDAHSPGSEVDINSPCPSIWTKENLQSRPSVIASYEQLGIGRFTSLRSLSLDFSLSGVADEEGQLALLSQMLRDVRNLEHLATISLTISSDPDNLAPIRRRCPLSPSWDSLDRCLGEGHNPKSAPVVQVTLLADIPRVMHLCLPRLARAGRLEVLENPYSCWDWNINL